MYKMLLVEDEPIVRLALKTQVNWQKYGFDEIFEASNGAKALDIIKECNNIDIVITDINMPVMNGITLIKESKKINNNIQFLVLSAYDDYNLVRDAFKLGVNDYTLKTEMDMDKILQTVLNMLTKLKKNTNIKEQKVDKQRLKKRLLIGDLNEEELQESTLRLHDNNYVCCYIFIDNFNGIKNRYNSNDSNELISSLENAITQVLVTINNGEILVISPKEYVIFFSFQDDVYDNLISRLKIILEKIRYTLFTFFNIGITVGVSGFTKNIEETNVLFNEAERNARMRFVFGKGKDIFSEHVESLNNIKKNKNNDLTQKIIIEMSKNNGLLKAIDELDEKKCLEEMKKILKIKELSFKDNLDNGYIYYLEIVLMMVQYIIKDEDNILEDIIGGEIDFYNDIIKFETIKEIESWVLDILAKVISYLKRCKQSESSAVKEAKEYILKNYSEKISLELVSKTVGFSKAYFSKIFTEEVGDNFIIYLTKVRIENAKKLLKETDMKIYQICEKVGYPNIEHFSRTFKKIVGVSPFQYKNK